MTTKRLDNILARQKRSLLKDWAISVAVAAALTGGGAALLSQTATNAYAEAPPTAADHTR